MDDPRADGDLEAFCQHEHPRLVGMLALYTGSRATGEELAQEALLRLYHHWPRVRHGPSPHAWLFRVGLNLARSWWRRHHAELRANQRHSLRWAERSQVNGATETEPAEVLTIRAAVAALPRRQRAALVLRYYGDLSIEETAEALGCAPGTVKSLSHRAVGSLRTALQDPPSPAPPSKEQHHDARYVI